MGERAPGTAAERAPPHNLDAEMSLLGAILTDCHAAAGCFQVLTADDFYSPRHGRIFTGLQEIFDARSTVDEILLAEHLERQGHLEAVGGLGYVEELIQRLPIASNAEFYAEIVREKSRIRQLSSACHEVLEKVRDNESDARGLQDFAEQRILESGDRDAGRDFVAIGEILTEQFDRIENPEGDAKTVYSGFYDLDAKTTGLHPSEFIIVAGRPSMGKTSFSMCIVQNAAVAGKAVAVFSLEVAKDQLVQNLLCSFSRVDSHKVRKKSLDKTEWRRLLEGASQLGKMKIFIDDTPGLTPMTLKAKARRLHNRQPLDMIVIDYLQLMESGMTGAGDNRQQEVSTISRSLKALARELQVPVITLSQLSRGVESRHDKRPLMSDLRESGAIEQDADVVLLLYRDEYYNPENEESKGKAECIIAKQRNGPTGTVELAFLGSFMKFENLTERDDEF